MFSQTRYLAVQPNENSEHDENINQYCLIIEPNANDANKCQENNTPNAQIQNEENDLKFHRHSVWLDCSISNLNRFDFMLANLLISLALFFGINLSNLTICQPTILKLLQIYFESNAIDSRSCDGIFYHLK